ncbi:hypothetical protein [Streptomyces sp. NRRL F-2664]|uniref:hypothetical protein n=1 Tax=Streptomyces sp. NRRL F-2664 TaxID=1463842 RepID=UPI0004CAC21C|nr:hypothetical protein [Streptomyces sp. NRRL F-2664]
MPDYTQAERAEAERLIADAFNTPTSYRDTSLLPAVGPTPPVPQPGRPPMSQKATDTSALMLAGSVVTMSVGGATSLVLIASDYADPAVIAMICAAPAAVAVPILAIARMLRGAKTLVPDSHTHNYNGPVSQEHRNVTTQTRGIWARTTNNGN